VRGALGFLLGCFARVWVLSLRFVVRESGALGGEARPWSLAFLHGQQLALLGWKRRRRTAVLVSLSRDGDLQARALPCFGLTVRRGSTSRGAVRGLVAIARLLREGSWDAAFAVDGPRGPIGVVHPGVIAAAARAGGVVVPMASAAERKLVLARAWDRFEIPLPFSRVAVVVGAPIEVAHHDLERSSREIAAAIERLRRQAEELVGLPPVASAEGARAA
jgi:lysophospholipid acyltransferase (LPLAT)-like uncharacterized protein